MIKRLILLNQMAGPLFRELAIELAAEFQDGCLMPTGHPDTLLIKDKLPGNLELVVTVSYNRKSSFTRAASWIKYLITISRFIIFAKKTDAFLLTTNPPILGGWFWLLSRVRNRAYGVLVYDIYPDFFVMMGLLNKKSLIVKIWHFLNAKVYSDASFVISLGENMLTQLKNNYKIDQKKMNILPPWVDTEIIKPLDYNDNPLAKTFNPERKHVVLYSGNMGISHDIESILEASKSLSYRKDILFIFIGGGEKWHYVNDYKGKHNLDNIQVYRYITEDQLPYSMTLSTISLITMSKGSEELMIPSKLSYYLAAGSAIIGICQSENEMSKIIVKGDFGICIEPNNAIKLANSIKELIDNKEQLIKFKVNARQAAVLNYSKKINVIKLIACIKQLKNSGK